MNCIYPTSSFHDSLRQIHNGKGILRVLSEDLAYDKHEELKESILVNEGLTEVLRPKRTKLSGDMLGWNTHVWVVETRLTNVGEACMLTLERGCVWNWDTSSVDLMETLDWYELFLKQGSIRIEVVDLGIALTDPFLADIQERFVYFKMRAQRDQNNRFYTLVDG